MSVLSNLLIPAVLFFALGVLTRLTKSDLRLPPDLAKLLLVAFGVITALIGGMVGIAVAHWGFGFGIGGTTLLAVLGASASYIAVPPAMRLAVPVKNQIPLG